MTADDRHYLGAILEEMRDNFKVVTEAVSDLQRDVRKLKSVPDDITEMKADIRTIKSALTDTNKQVHNHETRITKLEHAKV